MNIKNIIEEYDKLVDDKFSSNKNINNGSNVVKDLIYENSVEIVVLESPHREELYSGLPLSGKAGDTVSKHFLKFDKYKNAFGPQISNYNSIYGVMNTCQLPLQSPSNVSFRSDPLKIILEYMRTNPGKNPNGKNKKFHIYDSKNEKIIYKYDIKNVNIIIDKIEARIFNDFKSRLNKIKNIEKVHFYVCGSFAMYYFNILLVEKTSKITRVSFIHHPSSTKFPKEMKNKC